MLDLDAIWQRHTDQSEQVRQDLSDLIAEVHSLRAVCAHIVRQPDRAVELATHARDGFPGPSA